MLFRKDYKKNEYPIDSHDSLVNPENDLSHVDERRYAAMLSLTAGGTLVMGIWSFVKTFMLSFSEIRSGVQTEGIPTVITVFGTALVFAFFFVIVIMFRFIIWKGASGEARDGKERNAYITCAVVLIAFEVYNIFSFIRRVISKDMEGHDLTTMIFDLTSLVILCELLHYAFRLRKTRKENSEVL